jgi:hypothetical protein
MLDSTIERSSKNVSLKDNSSEIFVRGGELLDSTKS